MDADYYGTIALTFIGFVALAAALLVPIYRFLKRQDEENERWSNRGKN